ncbi:MAG TPA: hypothetical protein ENG13_03305 [bacterium]|nr:hypothetical protein [bacterium]HEX68075.1 hypothetical protein [bacterium]
MRKGILIAVILLCASVLQSAYEEKLVDDFERGRGKNLVGGKYWTEGEGISFWFTRAYAGKGRYSLLIKFNVPLGSTADWVCGLNGLDMSQAVGLSLYMRLIGKRTKLKLVLEDKKGGWNEVVFSLSPGGWRYVRFKKRSFPEVDFNSLSLLRLEFAGGSRGKLIIDEIKFFGPSHLFFLSLKDNLYGFPSKLTSRKEILNLPDSLLLQQILNDTLKHFKNLVDKRTYLPVDWIELSPEFEYRIGDYTSPTNIGLYLMVLSISGREGWWKEEEVKERITGLLNTLENLPRWKGFWYNWYSTTNLQVTSPYISTVDNGWLAAGFIILRQAYPEDYGEKVSKWLKEMDFSVLYDDVEGQFYLGYQTDKEEYSPYHYGLIATEARIASLIAIGKGDVPPQHWFRIYRTLPRAWKWQRQKPEGYLVNYLGVDVFEGYYTYKGMKIVPSWGGSSFEFLMPTLVVKEKTVASRSLGINDERAVKAQIMYAEEKGYPVWGFSPCALPNGRGYEEFGVGEIGSKGYPDKGVVSPYASILGLEFFPQEVIKNIREFLRNFPSLYGEYGFYDSVDLKKGITSTRYLTLDQAMIFLSIANYLTQGKLREWFHQDPIIRNAEKVLWIEEFFPSPPKREIKERFIICDFNKLERKNVLGGEFGSWDMYPSDPAEIAMESLVKGIKKGEEGYSLQFYYVLNSSQPSSVGFWMDMKDFPVKDYKYLGFWIKGDEKKGFTQVVKVEVVNEKGEKGCYFVTDVDKEWKEVIIPLDKFMGISCIKKIKEIVFVFEDRMVTEREGVIYIDDVFMAK